MYKGLSSDEAHQMLDKIGINEIDERRISPIVKFLKWFIKPTSLMIEFAFILSFIANRVEDMYVILSLLLINVIIHFTMNTQQRML